MDSAGLCWADWIALMCFCRRPRCWFQSWRIRFILLLVSRRSCSIMFRTAFSSSCRAICSSSKHSCTCCFIASELIFSRDVWFISYLTFIIVSCRQTFSLLSWSYFEWFIRDSYSKDNIFFLLLIKPSMPTTSHIDHFSPSNQIPSRVSLTFRFACRFLRDSRWDSVLFLSFFKSSNQTGSCLHNIFESFIITAHYHSKVWGQ